MKSGFNRRFRFVIELSRKIFSVDYFSLCEMPPAQASRLAVPAQQKCCAMRCRMGGWNGVQRINKGAKAPLRRGGGRVQRDGGGCELAEG
jgi:hypothetical protein